MNAAETRTGLSGWGASLYKTVREEIRRRIQADVYEVGQPIPSTASLSQEFKVSPITVKRALSDLRAAGLLRSVPGKGTFVKERRRFIRALDVWMTSIEDAQVQGLPMSLWIISVTKERVPPALAVFHPPHTPCHCIQKVIYADDLPIMYDTSYLPLSLDDSVIAACSERLISDALEQKGFKLRDSHLVIDAAPASLVAQRIFSVPNGYPSLRRLYDVKTSKSSVSVLGVVESPFDRLACSINLSARSPLNESFSGDRTGSGRPPA